MAITSLSLDGVEIGMNFLEFGKPDPFKDIGFLEIYAGKTSVNIRVKSLDELRGIGDKIILLAEDAEARLAATPESGPEAA